MPKFLILVLKFEESEKPDMNFTDSHKDLEALLKLNLNTSTHSWLQLKMEVITNPVSAKQLYLTYSLLAGKIDANGPLGLSIGNKELQNYLEDQKATVLQMARIYLLSSVLKEDENYFQPKVANLIQVADTRELETFLKFLVLLPHCENYKHVAVEALRTNIAIIFEAISMKNPYPAQYFNDQQWNQMYLKAAFMQLDLSNILDVDRRANKDLARIISDYAHERWAASRTIDPMFWRPVSNFIDENLARDMQRLLESENTKENWAGALCCFHSDKPEAKKLLKKYPELEQKVANKEITWQDIKN